MFDPVILTSQWSINIGWLVFCFTVLDSLQNNGFHYDVIICIHHYISLHMPSLAPSSSSSPFLFACHIYMTHTHIHMYSLHIYERNHVPFCLYLLLSSCSGTLLPVNLFLAPPSALSTVM